MTALLNKLNILTRISSANLIKNNVAISSKLYSTQHTLNVREQIEKTRKQALEAGGKKRIDKQHAKV